MTLFFHSILSTLAPKAEAKFSFVPLVKSWKKIHRTICYRTQQILDFTHTRDANFSTAMQCFLYLHNIQKEIERDIYKYVCMVLKMLDGEFNIFIASLCCCLNKHEALKHISSGDDSSRGKKVEQVSLKCL